jgi:hypothetical protein
VPRSNQLSYIASRFGKILEHRERLQAGFEIVFSLLVGWDTRTALFDTSTIRIKR